MTPSLVHHALLYGRPEDFLTVAVPFLRAGMEADDAVVVVTPSATIGAVRDVLSTDSGAVRFMDAAGWYQHPVRTIAAYNDFVHASAPRRVRLVAEPVWQGRSPAETVEWQRYESIVNVAFAKSGAQVICLYDKHRLSPEVLSAARRTHPEIFEEDGLPCGDGYVEPTVFSANCDRLPLPPPAHAVDSLPIESENDLHPLRTFVTERAEHRRMAPDSLNKLLVAVTEIATNALRHGGPPRAVRIWAEDADLVCEVVDRGHWDCDAMAGFLPPQSAASNGFGLWAARMLVDLVQVRTGRSGTVVRLRSRCSRSQPPSATPPSSG